MFPCTHGGQCVRYLATCQGIPLCDDKSDVEACSPGLSCIDNFEPTIHTLNTVSAKDHTYCSYSNIENNGQYDTIGRVDEDLVWTLKKSEQVLDFNRFESCVDKKNTTGIMCGDQCAAVNKWCVRDFSFNCDFGDFKVSKENKRLCQNKTFWSNKSCLLNIDGYFISQGFRCAGTNQHCYYP